MAGNRRTFRRGYDRKYKKAVPKDLIDSLLADYKKPENLIGENGLLKQLTKLLVEGALDAEMSEHLGQHGVLCEDLCQLGVRLRLELKRTAAAICAQEAGDGKHH